MLNPGARCGDMIVEVPIRRTSEQRELIAVAGRDGPVLLAFTDEGALARWAAPGTPWASMRMSDLAQEALEQSAASVVVNPAGPYGGEVERRDLEQMASARAFVARAEDAGTQERVVSDPAGIEPSFGALCRE